MKIGQNNSNSVFNFINESVLNNKVILSEEDFKELMCELILEELSIAEEVEDLSWKIYGVIRRHITKLGNIDEPVIEGEFEYPCFGNRFNIIWAAHSS